MRYHYRLDVSTQHEETVPFSAGEEGSRDADELAAAAARQVQAAEAANEQTLRNAIAGRLAGLRSARNAIAAGSLFAGLSVNERNVIDALVQDDIGIARLLLRKLDGTD